MVHHMTTIVYRYGIHAPHEGADLVWQQMRAAHRTKTYDVACPRKP